MIEMPVGFQWPGLWRPFPLPSSWLGLVPSAENELQSETCAGHVLHRVVCRAVAYNAGDVNELLFVTDDPAVPLAFVHLTFRAEIDSIWPYTVI